MPKLIDYPRTSYAGAWEIADVVDDTGGKCALETCARKLDRKVSGSFKAIVGSAVKFGLLTSKREMLTTTTLFRRIKHAYDKQEEIVFHREAFLTPPLFTQLCRKFRSRELPVQMLDIMLIREFDVEEINAQGVAKAFTDGARMVGLLDERNIIADIDQLAAQQGPRRELASPTLGTNTFRDGAIQVTQPADMSAPTTDSLFSSPPKPNLKTDTDRAAEFRSENQTSSEDKPSSLKDALPPEPLRGEDAVANLFGLTKTELRGQTQQSGLISSALSEIGSDVSPEASLDSVRIKDPNATKKAPVSIQPTDDGRHPSVSPIASPTAGFPAVTTSQVPPPQNYRIELIGPGINTALDIQDEDDLALVRFLLNKIERQLRKS